jgi:hypothetical protein
MMTEKKLQELERFIDHAGDEWSDYLPSVIALYRCDNVPCELKKQLADHLQEALSEMKKTYKFVSETYQPPPQKIIRLVRI